MNTEELLLNHRTVRKYQDKTIPEEMLRRILECGIRGSNTGNMQMYSIIATRTPEMKEKLAALHYGQGSTCDTYLTICVDVNRYHHWTRQRGCDEPYNNMLWLMNGTIDATICAQNICVAAESEGLGFCYLGTVLYNAQAISELLELPKGVVPVITLSLGFPDNEPALSERLPLEGVLHMEKYQDYSDEDIDRIHETRETFPFNQEMVRINNVRNLAELFTQKRYPKKDNEAFSESFMKLCKEKGF